jgi:nicotinamide-nucleotide amidase
MDNLSALAAEVLQSAQAKSLMIATAESCTGGMVAAALTEIAGSSAVFERGFVTYSNLAKHEMLGMPESLIMQHGAVSGEVAIAMAEGAIRNSAAQLSVSITGIAGPAGGSETKPVGTVFIGCHLMGKPTQLRQFLFSGDRSEIRHAASLAALELLRDAIIT